MSYIYAIFSFIFYAGLFILKAALVITVLAALAALILALIPIKFNFRAQNLKDEEDNVIFKIGWLFSAVTIFASANISGYYEYGVTLFGRSVFKKREILYDEESL